MSEPASASARPPQVTVAAWVVMIGSVFVVLMVWDRIAGLHSLASRQSLQSMLDQPGLHGLGLQVTDLMAVVKVLSMVSAGCATAMAILGYQTLQRSRGARLGLSVLAVPMVVAGLVTGGFLTSAVAAATATLWLGPAGPWFRGEEPAAAAPRPQHQAFSGTPTAPETRTPVAPPPPPAPSAPAPYDGSWGAPATHAYARPVETPKATAARPAAVLWACVLTWAFAGLALLVLGATLVLLSADSSSVLDKMHAQNPSLAQQGLSDHVILVVCWVTCAVLLTWSVAAVVVAAFVLGRARWSWYGLVVSTVGVTGICLLGALGSLLMLVPLAGAAVTISLLVRPEVRRWVGVR